ncbi:hypothetical protein [Moraxella lacunata]|uniref:hypothetical protein n=1 Tax=Moraxella lacunata TaxID=477 RepID=UPI003EE22D97
MTTHLININATIPSKNNKNGNLVCRFVISFFYPSNHSSKISWYFGKICASLP